jgi:hypothetical protein
MAARPVEFLYHAGAAVHFPLEQASFGRVFQSHDQGLPGDRRGVSGPQAGQACHELAGAALAHGKQLLDGQAVEVGGFHAAQDIEDFVKPVKPRGLVRHTGNLPLLYVRERSGTMLFFWKPFAVLDRGAIMNDKGRYHSR